jgi:hypothetical protein
VYCETLSRSILRSGKRVRFASTFASSAPLGGKLPATQGSFSGRSVRFAPAPKNGTTSPAVNSSATIA